MLHVRSGNFERRQQLIQCSANSFLRAENSEIDNALSEKPKYDDEDANRFYQKSLHSL